MYTIYIIKNIINSKWYVGQTKKRLSYRWNEHTSLARKGGGGLLHRAMRKHGVECFWIEPILTYATGEEADAAETELISVLSTDNPRHGYNLSPGGGSEHYKYIGRATAALRSYELQSTHEDIERLKAENSARIRGWQARRTPEERSATLRMVNAALTPEQHRERMRKANASRTPEMVKAAHEKRLKNIGPEARRAAARKTWETRRRKIAAGLEESPSERMRRNAKKWAQENPERARANALNASQCATRKRREQAAAYPLEI